MIKEIFSTITFEVEPAKATALRVGNSRILHIEAGTVWLTRSGDAGDYWLAAGTVLALHAGEILWLSAEQGQPARVVFRRPARRASRTLRWLARRLWHRVASVGTQPRLV